MKAEFILYVALMLGIGLLSLSQSQQQDPEFQVTKVIPIGHGTNLKIDLNAKVYVTHGDGQSLVIEGSQKQIDQLSIEENSNKLNISDQKKGTFLGWQTKAKNINSAELKIYINMEDLTRLAFTDAAEIISSDYQIPAGQPTCVAENINIFQLNKSFFLHADAYQLLEQLSNDLLGAILPDELLCLLRSETGQVCKLT